MIDIIYIYTLFTHKILYLGSEEATPETVYFSKLFFSPGKEAELGREMQIRNWAVNDSMTAQPEMDGLTV